MPETLDGGLALIAGLNAVPKRATFNWYSARVDQRRRRRGWMRGAYFELVENQG